jgi:hypothetical protein
VDVAFDHVVAHEAVSDIRALAFRRAENQRMPEQVALIDESISADPLALAEVFEGMNSRGRRSLVSSRISPWSTSDWATGGTFGMPACGPPRHVLSWKPSATVGNVEKNISSSRRI